MPVAHVHANGIDIAYETFGDPNAPPLLLVMGLATQMLGWPDPFCIALADRGFYVIRFDNRDIGLSTHLDGTPVPGIFKVALRRARPPYTLDDMAADTIGLIEALKLDRVHLVGASMGGFIAQSVAILRPELVRSLTLIMTSTGSWRVGQATGKMIATVLRSKPATTREAAIETNIEMLRKLGATGLEFDEPHVREFAEASYDRAYDPTGTARQFSAVIGQRNRTKKLRKITAPSLVLHGLHDPLVAVSGGLALARAIPGARFVGFHGMGHGLPQDLWPQVIDEVVQVTRRA